MLAESNIYLWQVVYAKCRIHIQFSQHAPVPVPIGYHIEENLPRKKQQLQEKSRKSGGPYNLQYV